MTDSTVGESPRRAARARAFARNRQIQLIAAGALVAGFATAGTIAAVTADGAELPAQDLGPAARIAPIAAPTDASLQQFVVSVEERLAPEARTQNDPYLPKGTTKKISGGKAGLAVVTYLVTEQDGVEIERTPIATVVLKEATHKTVAVGTLKVKSLGSVKSGSNRAIGQDMALDKYGWDGVQWHCLDNLFTRESHWNHLAKNPSSGAYGIPQSLPGNKMAMFGKDWKTNPATQIEWGLHYIDARYGSPCNAWGAFNERSPHWY